MPHTHPQQVFISGQVVTASLLNTASPWMVTNIYPQPFNVGFGVIKHGGGDITFRVEHTFDDILDAGVSARAFIHADVTAALSSRDGNYAYPVRAIRVVVATASGSGGVQMTMIQSGL